MLGAKPFGGEESRAALLWLLGLFVLLRGIFFTVGSPPWASDTKFYFPWTVLAADGGQVPYRDFAVEYPPGCWPVIYWPRLLGPERGRLLEELTRPDKSHATAYYQIPELNRAFFHYRRVFRWQMFALDLAALALMAWLLARHVKKAPVALAVYGAGSLTLVTFLYDRLDLGLWFLVLLGGFLWLESWHGKRHPAAWLAASAFCWGLGIAYKLMPLVAVPALALALWRRSISWPQRLFPLVTGAVGTLGPFVLAAQVAGRRVLDFFQYHGQRGTQYESVWGSIQMLLGHAGRIQAKVVEVAKAADVQSPLAPALVWASYVLTIASVGWICWQLWRCPREKLPRLGLVGAGLCLLWMVAWGKVFSPQYLIWAGPMAVLVVALGVPRQQQLPGYVGLFAVWLLTAAIYPWGYLYWGLESSKLVVLVLLRNVLMVGLCGWLSWWFSRACHGAAAAEGTAASSAS